MPSAPSPNPICTATSKQTGERCRQHAIPGGTVCRWHGGRAPQVEAVAKRKLVEQEATKELARAEVVPLGDPVVALADLAAESITFLEVAKRNASEGTGPDTAWMALYERAMDRCHRMLEACGRLGLEQRRVRIEEDKLDLMDRAMRRAWAALGHDQDDPAVQAAIDVAWREIEGDVQQ